MASIGTVLFVRHYGDAGATISTVVVTVVVLVFGEISPKSVAKDCAERFAMFSAPILRVLHLRPHAAQFPVFALEKAAGEGVPPERREQNVAGGAADARR